MSRQGLLCGRLPIRIEMPLSLNIDVIWYDDRTVHVRCTESPYVPVREERLEADFDSISLFPTNVESRQAALEFLEGATRLAAGGAHLQVHGYLKLIQQLACVLGVVGPPPERIIVRVVAP